MVRSLPAILLILLAGSAPAATEDDPVSLFEEGRYQEKVLGQDDRACELYRRAWRASGNDQARGLAAVRLAACLRRAGSIQEAAEVCAELAASPLAELHVVREALAPEHRLIEGQLEDIRQTDELARANEELMRAEADESSSKKEIARLRENVQRLQEREAKRRRDAQQLFERSRQLRDLEQARDALLRAVGLDPEHAEANAELLRIELAIKQKGGKVGAAEEFVAQAHEIKTEVIRERVREHDEAGQKAFFNHDYDGAVEAFSGVILLRRQFPLYFSSDLIEYVERANEYIVAAVERGARRPNLLPLDGEKWKETLRGIIEGATEAAGALRFYALSPLIQRAAEADVEPTGERESALPLLRRVPASPYPTGALVELIRLEVAPESWSGREYFARAAGETLIVAQEDPAHEEIDALLGRFRAAKGAPETFTVSAALVGARDLRESSRRLNAVFRERDGVGFAVLGAAQLETWRADAVRRRPVGARTLEVEAYHAARVDRIESEMLVVGRRDRESIKSEFRHGLRLDLLHVPAADGAVRLGVQGTITRLGGPVRLESLGAGEIRIPALLEQSLALAVEVPADGALLIVGLANPNRTDGADADASLALLVARGRGVEDADESGALDTERGVRLVDLVDARDFPAADFDDLDRQFHEGSNAPLDAGELTRRSLDLAGLEVVVRDDVIVPVGDGATDAASALDGLRKRREQLVDVRVRTLTYAKAAWSGELSGRAVAIEGSGTLRAWIIGGDDALPDGVRERGRVRRLPVRPLQRFNASRVERASYVGDYDVERTGDSFRYRPILSTVGRGSILDARLLPDVDGRPAFLSVVARAARLEELEEIYPFVSEELPAESPRTTVRSARIATPLPAGSRLVIAGFPDPDGGPGDRLAFDVTLR